MTLVISRKLEGRETERTTRSHFSHLPFCLPATMCCDHGQSRARFLSDSWIPIGQDLRKTPPHQRTCNQRAAEERRRRGTNQLLQPVAIMSEPMQRLHFFVFGVKLMVWTNPKTTQCVKEMSGMLEVTVSKQDLLVCMRSSSRTSWERSARCR